MGEGTLQAEVYECIAKAAQGTPWLESLLAGEAPDTSRLDIQSMVSGLTVAAGAIIEALDLIAARIDSDTG